MYDELIRILKILAFIFILMIILGVASELKDSTEILALLIIIIFLFPLLSAILIKVNGKNKKSIPNNYLGDGELTRDYSENIIEDDLDVIDNNEKISKNDNEYATDLNSVLEINCSTVDNNQFVYKMPKVDDVFKRPSLDVKDEEYISFIKEKIYNTLYIYRISALIDDVELTTKYIIFKLILTKGTKISSLKNRLDDFKYSIGINEIIIDQISGTSYIGIYVPRRNVKTITIRDIVGKNKQLLSKMRVPIALGKEKDGADIIFDLNTSPHMLIGGSTGTGKSTCIHTIINTILVTKKPLDVKLVMIDTSKVELATYNGIPHLYYPVVTDPKQASIALQAMVIEMENRYQTFADNKVKNITGYNEMIAKEMKKNPEDTSLHLMPSMVIIIDDFADLISVDKRNVIESLTRISANGNNAGMNLIISTQRPSSNIITNDIKINICTRIAFFVPSIYDSKAILDVVGAEKLNKKGDMLLIGRNRPLTMIHGAYITDDEIEKVIRFVSSQMLPQYEEIRIINEVLDKAIDVTNKSKKASDDPLYNEMLDYAIRAGSISASKLQRQFGIGFNRASKIIDEFEADGIVGPQKGSEPREVLIKMEGTYSNYDE